MPTTNPVNSVTGASTGTQSTNKFAQMDSGKFVKLMVAELTSQDPFKPNDTNAIMEQLSTLRNIESQNQLQTSLESMVNQQSISQASSLIGSQVTGLDDKNKSITGIVTSIRIVKGKAQLQLHDNKSLQMSRITQIEPQKNDSAGYLWDTNGDNKVTTYDYEEWYKRWAQNQGKEPAVVDGKIKTWQFKDGDFTGDGKIDLTDLTLLQRVFADINNPKKTGT